MENAAKALIIAGGILLALMIITFSIYMIDNVRTIRNAEAEKLEQEQLQKFNQEYEVYNKQVMYGGDVISVINKIKNNNATYKDEPEYQMSYVLTDFIETEIGTTEIYKCTNITYSNTTGRVRTMTFAIY